MPVSALLLQKWQLVDWAQHKAVCRPTLEPHSEDVSKTLAGTMLGRYANKVPPKHGLEVGSAEHTQAASKLYTFTQCMSELVDETVRHLRTLLASQEFAVQVFFFLT